MRYSLRPWPGPEGLWLDLANRCLGRAHRGSLELDRQVLPRPLDDVLYLPPVGGELADARRRLVVETRNSGTPVLVQHLPGDEPLVTGPGAIVDLLAVLVAGDLDSLRAVPLGAVAVWPLVAGYTDDRALWREGLSLLFEARVEAVVGIAPDLSPAERRRVVAIAGESGFEALFHGAPPSERAFARAVAAADLRPFPSRPLPLGSGPLAGNRRIAACLASAAELWLRLGRPEGPGQALYRAARLADAETHDLTALAREGNLGVLSWLDREGREVVEEVAERGRSSLLGELEGEYLAGPDAPAAP